MKLPVHFATGKARTKAAHRRCRKHDCPVMTRHRSGRCHKHRTVPRKNRKRTAYPFTEDLL